MELQKDLGMQGNAKEQIKLVGLLHFLGNIFSGGVLGTILVVVYLFITKDLHAETKAVIYEIINFNLSFLIYFTVSFFLIFILIGFLLLPIVGIIWLVGLIIGFIKHLSGENYTYFGSIPFLK